jgi:hypothetical protein
VLAVDAVGTGDLDRLVSSLSPAPSFETLRLTTGEALDQYLHIYLKLPIRRSWLGTPRRSGPLVRIFDYVSAAAPGVREILVIGKIGWEARTGDWDEIIVDGPATGHVVELIDAPRAMAELVPTGPLAEQTGWLRRILAAPSTGVVLVTTPDELPVTEAIELTDRLRNETETSVRALLVNRVPQAVDRSGEREARRLAAAGSPLAPAADLAVRRSREARAQIDRLAVLDLPLAEAPEDWIDPVGSIEAAVDPILDDAWPRPAAGA